MSKTEPKPSDALSLDELEKDLFGEPAGSEDPEVTKKIDKFYTLYKKNEEFQKLLDAEYSRLRGDHIEIPEEELGEYAGVESNISGAKTAADTSEAVSAPVAAAETAINTASDAAEKEYSAVVNTGRTSAMVQGEGDTMSVNFDTAANRDAAVAKKKKKPVWLIVLIIAIIVIAACAFGIMHFGLLDSTDEAVGEVGKGLALLAENANFMS